MVKKKKAPEKADAKKMRLTKDDQIFDYYKVQFKLIDSFLATGAKPSIWEDHNLKKAQKEIKKANSLKGKMTKALQKYAGTEISESKQIQEIQGLIRAFAGLTGDTKHFNLPDDMEKLQEIYTEVEEKYDAMVAAGELQDATVFMRDENDWPIISTHMFLGNLKENLTTRVRNGDKTILQYQNAVGGTFATEVQPVESFMTPDHDIVKDKNGDRVLCERPVRFTDKKTFQETTAILISEQLPEGTKFECTLRVVKGSPITEKALRYLLNLGKNNGFGAHRGSGNHGHYRFKLTKLLDFSEKPDAEGYL